MKKHHLSLCGIVLLTSFSLLTSCKKHDVVRQTPSEPVAAEATKSVPAAAAQWATVNWRPTQSEKFTTYQSRFSDSAITAGVLKNGLVLLYVNTGTQVQTLPFDESSIKRFWNYEVTPGAITIACDVYEGGTKPEATISFQHIVLTAEQIKSLEAKGKSKAALMDASYAEVKALL